MVEITDIDGWEHGGALAGRDVYKILGQDSETGAVLHLKIRGPTESKSTTYVVALQKPGDTFPETYIATGIESVTEAELKALEYAQNH